MAIPNIYDSKRPRTIDILQISDCREIIFNDLARYGIPEDIAVNLVKDYFIPLEKETRKLKKDYGDLWFKNAPDNIFE